MRPRGLAGLGRRWKSVGSSLDPFSIHDDVGARTARLVRPHSSLSPTMNSPRPPSSQRISLFPLSFPNNRPSGHQHQPDTQTLSPSSTDDSRSPSQPSPDLSRSPSARSARMSSSLLPALRLAGLAPDPDRERDRARDRSSRDMRSSSSRSSKDTHTKPRPLLVLKLSGSSFLDAIIRDDRSKDPLYILETSSDITSIHRLDHPRDVPIKAATVQWPLHPVRVKGKSGRTIQISGGSWREAEDILKSGPLGNTAYAKTPLDHHLLPLLTVSSSSSIRKFNLPHYPNSLKWKLIPGNCFCVRPCLHASFGASPLLSLHVVRNQRRQGPRRGPRCGNPQRAPATQNL